MRRLLVALCLLSAMSGCQGINEAVSNSVSPGSPVNQNDQEIALYQSFITPDAIRQCLGQVRGSGARQSCRDLITYARLKYADLNYERFRRDLFATVNGGNTAADLTILGLGSAGALVPGATTKAILAAISAGISGGKGIVDRDLLYNAGIQTLIQKMDGDRGVIRVKITTNLAKYDEKTYPFEQAELDSADYYQAGTLTDALISLQGQAASQANAASTAINGTVQPPASAGQTPAIVIPAPAAPQPAAPLAPASGPSAGSGPPLGGARPVLPPQAALPAPPPLTTPVLPPVAIPAAPPVAALPPVVSVPPAATAPASPPSPVSVAAADQAALSTALGFNPTAQSYDGNRIKLMKACWKKLGIKVPGEQVSQFLYNAEYVSKYRAVADCITEKATK